jgi:hypothetical protein
MRTADAADRRPNRLNHPRSVPSTRSNDSFRGHEDTAMLVTKRAIAAHSNQVSAW